MSHSFRICPKNALIIEWSADNEGSRFCFYKTNDSPADARRCLSVLRDDGTVDAAQPFLLEEQP